MLMTNAVNFSRVRVWRHFKSYRYMKLPEGQHVSHVLWLVEVWQHIKIKVTQDSWGAFWQGCIFCLFYCFYGFWPIKDPYSLQRITVHVPSTHMEYWYLSTPHLIIKSSYDLLSAAISLSQEPKCIPYVKNIGSSSTFPCSHMIDKN